MVVLCFGISSSQATGYGLCPRPVAGYQLWMWGLKNDSTNDRSTSPLEEQVFGVIPLGNSLPFLSNNTINDDYKFLYVFISLSYYSSSLVSRK
jgi:hypothetical protein